MKTYSLHLRLRKKVHYHYLTTTANRKKTSNDIYLNWNAFAPVGWK